MLQKAQQGVRVEDADKNLTGQASEHLRELARRLIEESLITPGNRRNSVVDDTLISEYHVSPDFLDTLVDKSRLLRKEPRLDDFYYEISHDTLLPPVIESRNARRDKERADREKAEYQARLNEEAQRREAVEAELTATRRQRKLARTVAALSFVSLLVCLACAIWFIDEYVQNARDQLEQAEFYVENELYYAADRAYDELIKHKRRCWVLENTRPHKDVCAEYDIVKEFRAVFNSVESNQAAADSLMLIYNYARALDYYHLVADSINSYRALNERLLADTLTKERRVDPQRIVGRQNVVDERIRNARLTLIREFKISQREYESFVEAKVWGQALRNLRRMKQLLPAHPADEAELQTALKINERPVDYINRELALCEARLKGI
jgi:hypothetical protein